MSCFPLLHLSLVVETDLVFGSASRWSARIRHPVPSRKAKTNPPAPPLWPLCSTTHNGRERKSVRDSIFMGPRDRLAKFRAGVKSKGFNRGERERASNVSLSSIWLVAPRPHADCCEGGGPTAALVLFTLHYTFHCQPTEGRAAGDRFDIHTSDRNIYPQRFTPGKPRCYMW